MSTRRIIIGLMVPFFAVIFHLSTFVIAVPAIRGQFELAADTTSWLVLVFTVPYVLFMPFYGRMADRYGSKVLMMAGVAVYSAGSALCAFAPSMGFVVLGRLIQATGAASINPLSISIITRYFPLESRGRALGTWNSVGPLTGTLGPLAGGILIDAFGWRSVFVPVFVIAIIAIPVLMFTLPKDTKVTAARPRRDAGSRFDWQGMLLTAAILATFTFYVSSRPITGRAPFTDWRLLLALLAFSAIWYVWEKSRPVPFVAISLFRKRHFAIASTSVGFRMFYLGAFNFLVSLYSTDVLDTDASTTGLIIALHAFALLLTLRLGGRIADKISLKKPVVFGLFGQGVILLWLALAPGKTLAPLIVPVMLHGALAGFSLAPLHQLAMIEVPDAESGAGAGTYSMCRFLGSALGASLMGVVLETFLAGPSDMAGAYRYSFLVAAVVGLIGVMPTLFIRDIKALERN